MEPVGVETVNTVSLLAAVCDTLSAAYGCCFPPVCLNVVFLSLPPFQAALFRLLSEKRLSQNHIPSSRSFNCNRHLGNEKKPVHQCVPTNTKG